MPESATNLESLAPPAELRRMEAVPANRSLGWLTDKLTAFNEGKTPLWWWILFFPAAFCATVVLPATLIYKISAGVGVWGNNMPVMWGWDIINFVWWVGVAHAGTLISAMLFLTRQHWRNGDWPRGGGDDGFFRDDGGIVSGHPRRTFVVRLVHVSGSDFKRSVAAIPFAADVGRFRRQHLPHRFDDVLVYGLDSRSGLDARPRRKRA